MQTEELDYYLSQEPVTLPDGARIEYRDASRLDFREAVTTRVDFEFANLSGSNFTGALFRYCTFTGVNFRMGTFDGAEFVDCRFENCHFGKSSSQEARFQDCHFNSCDMRSSYFERAAFVGCTFDCSDLSQGSGPSVFAGSRFDNVQFRSCRLECMDADGAHFLLSRLDGCDLSALAVSGGNLFSTVITSSNMRGAYFDYATIDNSMIGGDIHNADFSGALVRESDLTETVGSVLKNEDTMVVESEFFGNLYPEGDN